ncbi:MAG TPA: hypothetical protein PKX94_01645 [Opitutales bacterium]|nr:hypothetical protein [Opitutales bacterium]
MIELIDQRLCLLFFRGAQPPPDSQFLFAIWSQTNGMAEYDAPALSAPA